MSAPATTQPHELIAPIVLRPTGPAGSRRGRATRAVVGVAALALGIAGCAWVNDHHAEDDATITVPVRAIRIENAAGEVTVHAGDAAAGIVVKRDIDYRGDTPPTPGQDIADGVLSLTPNCSGCGIAYDITVPASTAVTVIDHAGHVTLDGLAGPVDVTASAGHVEGRRLTSPQVTVEASAGAVDLGFTASPASVKAHSHAGEVTVSVPGGPYAVDATAKAGHRSVNVPADPAAEHRLTVSSDAGAVTVQPA